MKLKRKQKGYLVTFNKEFKIVSQVPNYEYVLEEPNLLRLVKCNKFYICLIVPSILILLLYLVTAKAIIILLSMLLALSLIPMCRTLNEIFNIIDRWE